MMAIVAILPFEGREKRTAIGGRIVLAHRELIGSLLFFFFLAEAKSVASPISSAIIEKD